MVASLAFRNAVSWYERPIAGALVDTNAAVSEMRLASWDSNRLGIHFPSIATSVDGHELTGPPSRRGSEWDRRVHEAASAGQKAVDVHLETPEGERDVTLRIHPLDPLAWWSLAGILFFAGVLYVAVGILALWASPHGRLARDFALLAVSCGLFLLTLFDFHTSRALVPVFFVAFAFSSVGFVLLALRLPDDVALLARWPRSTWIGYAAGALLAGGLVGLHALGQPTTQLQILTANCFGGAQVFFVATFMIRLFRAKAERKMILKALFLPMVPPYAVAGALQVLARQGLWHPDINIVLFPTLVLAPLASVYAFVRHDLWGSRALLSRVLTQAFVGIVVCAVAVGVGAALAAGLGVPFRSALFAAAAGGVLAAVMVVWSFKTVDRVLFPSRAEYKPTIEQLSAELLSITSPREVLKAIEHTVSRWLPCDDIELRVLEEARPTLYLGDPDPPDESVERSGTHSRAELTLPVAFEGKQLATLYLGKKRGGALFTTDDIDLLGTITNQGALALAHAFAYQELEDRRRQQAAAWRSEREALVETVAAEISHEIRQPLNFFRMVFEQAGRGQVLEAEDVDLARDEVDRLERLVAGLRRMAGHRLEKKIVRVQTVCDRVELLLKDSLGGRPLERNVDDGAVLLCDSDKLTQVLVNLVVNALQAAGEAGRVGIKFERTSSGAKLSVWDDGPGFVGEPTRLFAPWYTTKPRGTGLGLAIAHRLVRAHGWTIAASRREGRTIFAVAIVSRDAELTDDGKAAEVA